MNCALRDAPMILPKVWAMLETGGTADVANRRRRPHSLRLVRAQEGAAPGSFRLRRKQPSRPVSQPERPPAVRPAPVPEVAFYRKYTEAVLERCLGLAMEPARVPSLMGRELFRGNVSHSRVTGFDDVVHFVHDVENCIKLLSPGQQHLLRRIAMQGYSQAETSAMLGISLRTTVRRYNEALDEMTSLLMARGLLQSPVGVQQEAE